MARTPFIEFNITNKKRFVSAQKLRVMEEWYQTAQRDEDKAGDMSDACFYEGWKAATVACLKLILDMPEEG